MAQEAFLWLEPFLEIKVCVMGCDFADVTRSDRPIKR
jgi:hypothetical protein